MLRNLIYFSGSILIFFTGLIVYGILLNLREDTLPEAMAAKGIGKLDKVSIIVSRKNYRLDLYSDTVLVKSYKAVFGQSSHETKLSKNDNVTPLGLYKICSVDTNSQYHIKMYLDYPNIKDAAEALKKTIIDQDEYNRIVNAQRNSECPPADTKLGATIGIQGIGEYDFIFKNLPFVFNWTDGSIAVSNANMDELYSAAPVNTPVKIKN